MPLLLNILLALLPVFVLVTALLRGYYPGAVALDRIRHAVSLPPMPAGSPCLPSPRYCWAGFSRIGGGRLMGHSLAGRAPPPVSRFSLAST